MKGIKRVVSLILIAFVAMTINFNVTAKSVKAQDESFKWLYEETEDGIIINGYNGSVGNEIIIPSVIDGKSVVEFNVAFDYFKEIKKLYIPASVKKIHPFLLKMLVVKDDIEVDENNQNFSSEDGLLYNKDKTELIKGTNRECVKLPEGLKVIDDLAFHDCSNLTNVIFPESLCKLGILSYINGVYTDDNIHEYTLKDYGKTFYKLDDNGNAVIVGCSDDAKKIGIPDTIEGHKVISIANHAFCDNKNITSVRIDPELDSIGDYAFVNSKTSNELELYRT